MSLFSIIEFEDVKTTELQLVPNNWLKGTAECFSMQKNAKKLHKSIVECEEPNDENWEIVKIVRIFGTANSYESGIEKVKLAEQFSDIDSSDIDKTSKKSRHIRARRYSDAEDDNDDCPNTLPPPPKKPVIKTSIINPQNKKVKQMETLSPLQTKMIQNHNIAADTIQSVQDSVSKDSNSTNILADIELKKELLRKCNKIDAKLDRIEGRLNNIEEKVENGLKQETKENLDIENYVSFPLKTKEALDKLELDLQDANLFKNMIHFMKHLGGKTYHEMTVIILKRTLSNFLSTLYCWNGKSGKKEAFKDLLLAKCIQKCVHSKFETVTDQEIMQVISKWFLQGQLRHDRDEERLRRRQQQN